MFRMRRPFLSTRTVRNGVSTQAITRKTNVLGVAEVQHPVLGSAPKSEMGADALLPKNRHFLVGKLMWHSRCAGFGISH